MYKVPTEYSTQTRAELAMHDISDGLRKYPVWMMLGWQDIKQRYRRSVLGPLWITLTMVITIAGMGPLYAALFRLNIDKFIPYLALGLISWGLISTMIIDGCATFSSVDSLIRSVRLPFSTHVYRMIFRNFLIYFHNLLAFIPFMLYVGDRPHWVWLMILPGMLIVVVSSVPLAIILGLFCARFRDMQQIVGSIVQLAFFLTPVIWKPESLGNRIAFAKYNPLYMYVDMLRGPMNGYIPDASVYIGAAIITAILYVIAIPFFIRFRQRIAFWA